ncbi:hypothetical protein NDN08_004840 [Rhodosorus marinus]|uniref:V-type proton ATPase subunit C n=1 Tax=Rhodosorus marinus TaxID=101924 RepID=A0AAV8UMF2_9RHOD|nr:hypothetical protein NDN08_004840 [Rhodosorus marinus]
MKHWLVSAPSEVGQGAYEMMREKLENKLGVASVYPFRIPAFRVGTLDSLMALSDTLTKHDHAIEQVVDRLLRQYRDLSKKPDIVPLVEFVELPKYLHNFEWDEAKFSSGDTLEEIESAVMELVARTEDDLKIRLNDYTQTKQAVAGIERRNQGNLMTKSLVGIVKEEEYIETEHMQTVFIVVPSYNLDEFLSSYESLATMVIPRSAKVLTSDSDYALVSVTLFKKCVEEFKVACRERRFTVRDFKFKADDIQASEEEYARLRTELEDQHVNFVKWCETIFGEAVIAQMHLKAVRSFVESVLRYGLPVNFEVAMILPQAKSESRLRAALQEMYGHLGGNWASSNEKEGETTAIPGIAQEDFYPYVFSILNIQT